MYHSNGKFIIIFSKSHFFSVLAIWTRVRRSTAICKYQFIVTLICYSCYKSGYKPWKRKGGRIVITTKGPYPWSPVTEIFRNGYPSHDCDRTIFEVMISNWPPDTIGSVASSWAAILNQENHNRSHKLLAKLK